MKLQHPAAILIMCAACTAGSQTIGPPTPPDLSASSDLSDYRDIKVTDLLPPRYSTLTEADYRDVARRLGVDVAAIKAVVDIEAGHAHKGFCAPGKPIINFDLSMFRKYASKRGINLTRYHGSHAVVFNAPNSKRYGGQQQAQWARLESARGISREAANEGTFWGMFQIGGFNWKICGCSSLDDFVNRMSSSERDQLELFANLIDKTGMVKYLRAHNWAAFAQRYNGPGYRGRGYHTKMANAYARYSR